MGTVRADTTKDKFSTIPIALYGEKQPVVKEIDICSYLNADDYVESVKPTILYSQHSVFSIDIDRIYYLSEHSSNSM